jgi:hypothetical protein
MRRLKLKAVYPNHRFPPWLTEDATRDRSNRLLDAWRNIRGTASFAVPWISIWRLTLKLSKLGYLATVMAPKVDDSREIGDAQGQDRRGHHDKDRRMMDRQPIDVCIDGGATAM